MKKLKVVTLFLFAFIMFFSTFPIYSFAATNYPGTREAVKAGDVIFSPKGKSTFFVGHVAIVGTDGYIYHAYPNKDGKRRDSVNNYFNLFDSGNEFKVLRPKKPKSLNPDKAAEMAEAIYKVIEKYNVMDINLNNFADNYCSKLIWQAYFFTSWTDITNQDLEYNSQAWIYPNDIRDSAHFNTAVSFKK
ncbi:hypothetical protein WDD9_005261 [Paenibacillus melissococcoides]|nr:MULTISPECIES: hypothetical protein [Paenibacillus]MEB9895161.1 hypothetical protein [Bacillus cereus]GIO82060.1 hypothetical protein J6TS7_56700 [Paenibacillus dendritiformis]CAH8718520.1 hypothetical protein HTL2_005313 [Paenibacillus melissococcoides]CAH8718587.1 hypothetical protein WDD9_005261 [Paenibacillus melissococcoides]